MNGAFPRKLDLDLVRFTTAPGRPVFRPIHRAYDDGSWVTVIGEGGELQPHDRMGNATVVWYRPLRRFYLNFFAREHVEQVALVQPAD